MNKTPPVQRAVLVPRWSGAAQSDWYPWLEGLLKERGIALDVVPLLPQRDAPEIAPCLSALSDKLGDEPLDGSLLVGHSVGCQAILRYLATAPSARVRAAAVLLVAPWFRVDRPWSTLLPWMDVPFDLERARPRAGQFRALLSTNDPFTADGAPTARRLASALGAEVVTVSGGKHFNAPQEPAILRAVLDLLA